MSLDSIKFHFTFLFILLSLECFVYLTYTIYFRFVYCLLLKIENV